MYRSKFILVATLLAMTTLPAATAQRGDAPVPNVSDPNVAANAAAAHVGPFHHYYWFPASGGVTPAKSDPWHDEINPYYFALVPTNPIPNGGGIIDIVSGGFDSGTTAAVRARFPRYRELLAKGYCVFPLTHGIKNVVALDPMTVSQPRPGFMVDEILAQMRRGIRHIKFHYGTAHGSSPNHVVTRFGIMGSSSGGSIALQMLLSGPVQWDHAASPPDQTIDAVDPSLDCAFVFSAGSSIDDYRGAGDTAYPWKWPQFIFRPDYSHPNMWLNQTPLPYPTLGTVPSPPLGIIGQRCPCFPPQAFHIDPNTGEPCSMEKTFPDRNWEVLSIPCYAPEPALTGPMYCDPAPLGNAWSRVTSGGAVIWSGQNPGNPTGPALDYPAYCCPQVNELLVPFDTGTHLTNYAAAHGAQNVPPMMWLHGDDDGVVDIHQALRFEDNAVNTLGVPDFTLVRYAGERHSWRDMDVENVSAYLAFFDRILPTTPVPDADQDGLADSLDAQPDTYDQDGDEQPDGAEATLLAGSEADPHVGLRIDKVVQQASTTNITVTIDFTTPVGATFKLQEANSLDVVYPAWTDVAGTSTFYAAGSHQVTVVRATPFPTTPVPIDAYFWRITHVPGGGVFSRISSEPVGLVRTEVGRSTVAGTAYVNYVTPPLLPATTFQALVTASTSGNGFDFPLDATGNGPFAASALSDHYAHITRDIARTPPTTNPENRGFEGHWWPISANTSNSVDLQARASGTHWSAVGTSQQVAVRRRSSLEDLFGPLSPMNGIPGLVAGDEVVVHNGPNADTYTLRDTPPWFWEDTTPAPVNDPTAITFDPDEAISLVALHNPGGNSFVYSAGVVPMCDMYAYLEMGSLPNGETHASFVKGWSFPVGTQLDGRTDEGNPPSLASCCLVKAGVVRDSNDPPNPFTTDYLIHADVTDANYNGDEFGSGCVMSGLPTAARFDKHDHAEWSCLACSKDLTTRLRRGRGYEILLSTTHENTVTEWQRRRPYPRP